MRLKATTLGSCLGLRDQLPSWSHLTAPAHSTQKFSSPGTCPGSGAGALHQEEDEVKIKYLLCIIPQPFLTFPHSKHFFCTSLTQLTALRTRGLGCSPRLLAGWIPGEFAEGRCWKEGERSAYVFPNFSQPRINSFFITVS